MKMQKTYKILFALCVMMSVQSSMDAQTTHNLYLGAAGGYSSFMLKDAPDFSATGSWGGGFEAGYELNVRAFMLKLGAEFTYLNAGLGLRNFTQHVDLIDDDDPSEIYTGNYTFRNNSDAYRFGNLNVPLMIGFRVHKFYLLAGGKVGVNLFESNTTKTSLQTTGTYPGFIDDFTNMPNHSFYGTTEKRSYSGKFPLNAYASAEMGLYLNANMPTRSKYRFGQSAGDKIKYRLSAFADYGLMDLLGNTTTNSLFPDIAANFPDRPYLKSFVRSANMRGSVLNNLFVGLRFTILFSFEQKPDCGCNTDNK
jgi:hypothetical protein